MIIGPMELILLVFIIFLIVVLILGLMRNGKNIQLKHPDTGVVINTKIGFSWTTLFFGFFVPLFRGDFLWCIISIIITIVTGGLFWFIFPFFYNRIYIKNLLEKGYNTTNEQSKNELVQKGWISA